MYMGKVSFLFGENAVVLQKLIDVKRRFYTISRKLFIKGYASQTFLLRPKKYSVVSSFYQEDP